MGWDSRRACRVMRRAAKVDANHAEIVRALRAAGCGVLDLSRVGDGCPDLLVHAPTHPACQFGILLEIKDGNKPPSARKLTPAQLKFHAAWKGFLFVVENVEQALAAVGLAT
jgi:hypothetical protein